MVKKKIRKFENLCIILARGGSKGLKNKNIIDFFGKPLIYHTIKPIKDSKVFDKIIVSTDSVRIRNIAIACGVDAPFLRPKKFSGDNASFKDALRHALDWVKENYGLYENVLYTYPTNPLRKKQDYLKAYKLLNNYNSELIISVVEDRHPVFWSNKLKKNMSMKDFVDLKYCKNRQKLPITYHVDGSIWFGKWNIFYRKKNFYKVNSHAMVFPVSRSVDIDDAHDLEIAKIKKNENSE